MLRDRIEMTILTFQIGKYFGGPFKTKCEKESIVDAYHFSHMKIKI